MVDSLKTFLEKTEDGIYYVGHASALVRIDGSLILCDPVFGDYQPYSPYWVMYPKQIDCSEILDRIDACIVSHIHADHWSPEILSKLKCKVHIMRGRDKLREELLKYSNVVEHNSWDWVKLTDKTEVFFVDHSFNTVDSSCFISSKTGDTTYYIGSDNFIGRENLERLKKRIFHLDVAAIPTQFIHWWPFQMVNMTDEEKAIETRRLVDQSYKQAIEFVAAMKPNIWFPFGGDLYYNAGRNHHLNKHLHENCSFKAGCYILTSGGISTTHYSGVKEDFPSREETPIDPDIEITIPMLNCLIERVTNASTTVLGHTIIVNNIGIDMEKLQVFIAGDMAEKPYTKFLFDKKEFYQWLSGEITFEGAIGTRRFVCERVPNVYNLKVFEWFNKYL